MAKKRSNAYTPFKITAAERQAYPLATQLKDTANDVISAAVRAHIESDPSRNVPRGQNSHPSHRQDIRRAVQTAKHIIDHFWEYEHGMAEADDVSTGLTLGMMFDMVQDQLLSLDV